ncbi:hypothetical protein O9992_28690 [Vibrio lentus]|nr:hypothetical protein [Vibrio lentus]
MDEACLAQSMAVRIGATLIMYFADIRHIEVLKGPGGTIWGGNAVNGVVNIITKSANDTQGTYLSGVASNTDNTMNLVFVRD